MDTTTKTIDNNTIDANKMQPSSLMKLFGDDPDGKLQEARDKIYSYTWSRDRRDEGKLDWVLSQNGVNRNVPERFIEDTPYGSAAFKSIHELPCGLILTNKKISADFTRYIYSINDLEIDVDLKAIHTAENEAKLRRITTLLQNPNLVRYTRVVRVRIHFPDKYPFQALPGFNQRALEDIAITLDGFERIEHLVVRIVSMQGPMHYELRLASFPFYPMSFTDWSIRLLNDTASKWDIVGGEQLHQLNLAWEVYQTTESLTTQVNTRVTKENFVPDSQFFSVEGIVSLPKKPVTAQQKNGSQKRKARKIRGGSAEATDTGFASTTPSVSASSHTSSPVRIPLNTDGPDSSSGTELLEGGASSQSRSTNLEPPVLLSQACPAPELPAISAVSPSQPPSPPLSPIKLLKLASAIDPSASGTSGEVAVMPVDSVASPENHDRTALTQPSTIVEDTAETNERTEFSKPQTSCPPSPAPSSAAACQSQDEAEGLSEAGGAPGGAAPLAGEVDSTQPMQKKKRRTRRKKSNKSKAAGSPATPVESAKNQLVAYGVQLNGHENENENAITLENQTNIFEEPQGLQNFNGNILWQFASSPDVPLSELADLEPLTDSFCMATKADGTKYLMHRTREASWYLRQKQRLSASQLEKEAQMRRAKEIRQSKKVKEVLIRRRAPSHILRRQVGDTKQQKVGKLSSGSKKSVNRLSNDEDDRQKELLTSCDSLGASIPMTVPGTGGGSIEDSGELKCGNDEYDPRYMDPTPHEYECPQSSQPATENHNEWAGSTEDDELRFECQNMRAPTGQEMHVLSSDHSDMDAPVESKQALANKNWQCDHETDKDMDSAYVSSTLFAGSNSMDQDRHEDSPAEQQQLIEEPDEPYDA